MYIIQIGRHSGAVDSTVTSQQKDSEFKAAGLLCDVFLCDVSMCLRAPEWVSSYILKTYKFCQLPTLNCLWL